MPLSEPFIGHSWNDESRPFNGIPTSTPLNPNVELAFFRSVSSHTNLHLFTYIQRRKISVREALYQLSAYIFTCILQLGAQRGEHQNKRQWAMHKEIPPSFNLTAILRVQMYGMGIECKSREAKQKSWRWDQFE